jgi:hypothetical protein
MPILRQYCYLILVPLLGYFDSPAVLAQSCNTDCAASCRLCTETFFAGIQCTPPEPTCYGLCISKKAAECGRGATQKDQPIHGNYCGLGNRGGSPIDSLDAACKRHDDCYDRRGRAACSCDRPLAAEARGSCYFGLESECCSAGEGNIDCEVFRFQPMYSTVSGEYWTIDLDAEVSG